MRTVAMGLVVVAGLVIAAAAAPGDRSEAPAPRMNVPLSAAANNDLIAVTSTLGDRVQQVTIIDPKQRVMSVYHIELASGKIALRSVRNFQWDLKMTEFNGENPLPREIQALLEPR